jgi:tRNA dimethylallyltransferase
MSAPRALAIVGPTASGKTAVGLEVARRLEAEVVSLDSRAVYRGMDIGTAKPTAEERGTVPHHALDLVEPDDRFSAGRFAAHVRPLLGEICGRGRLPLLVGGTGFFLRALTRPMFREPPLDAERREALARWLGRLGPEEASRWLAELDPEIAGRMGNAGGMQRRTRALEVALLSGRPLSWWQRHSAPHEEPLRVAVAVLDVPHELLVARIEARLGEMVARGLLGEVARLRARYGDEAPGLNAHGYIEFIRHLRGERTLDEALEEVRRNTVAYTRRQRTWFRHQLGQPQRWFDAARPPAEVAEEIVEWWNALEGARDLP